MNSQKKVGRNDPCPCGAIKPDGSPLKYKKHCGKEARPHIPSEVLEKAVQELASQPREPFEKGGFLTGRPFIAHPFKGERMRAVANVIYRRPMDETFHMFLFRRFSDVLTQAWVVKEEQKENPHTLIKWFREAQGVISAADGLPGDRVRSVKLTGNMRALLAIAYDFYTLQHCGAPVPPKLLNRLRDEVQFQGARYEIAVAGLACRAGFQIKWVNDATKHCEFIGTHRVTGDRAAFEAKSHHREGVLGRDGEFNPGAAKTKVFDHIREAIDQAPNDDIPLVIFDDLNLPLSVGELSKEKGWFKEVEDHLQKYGFLNKQEYRRCAVLVVTNFSWHFHHEIPPEKNELVTHFHLGGRYSLKPDTILQYIDLAAKQYGFVPALAYEFEKAT